MNHPLIVIFMVFLSLSVVVHDAFSADQDEPLEISADESLEWHRNDLYFQARKNVKVVQGDTTLRSRLLKALYRDGADGGVDIFKIHAEGGVRIISADNQVFGEQAVYNVDKGYAVITGGDLKLVSDDQTVTARDKFEYWVNDGRLEAHGDAFATREGDQIKSDKIIAIFTEGKGGKRVLKQLEAIGNVVITTPDEVLKGNRAIYKAETNIAEIKDDVVIVRGPNKLQGMRAEVNLNTNVSKIFGGTEGAGGRVSGVFFPGSEGKSN